MASTSGPNTITCSIIEPFRIQASQSHIPGSQSSRGSQSKGAIKFSYVRLFERHFVDDYLVNLVADS